MNIRALTLAAGLTVAGSANAAFLGVDFVLDAARTAAAQATTAAGNDVFIMYAAFSDPADLFLNIFNVNFDAGAALFQHGNGTDLAPNETFFSLVPGLEYDSFVTVGGLRSVDVGSGVGVDGNGIDFITNPNGLTGAAGGAGWFTTPPTGLGGPQLNADLSAAMGINVYTVVLAQITVAQGPRATFQGDYTVGSNDPGGTTRTQNGLELVRTVSPSATSGFGFVPTPGAMALFGLAGLTATRRRRA